MTALERDVELAEGIARRTTCPVCPAPSPPLSLELYIADMRSGVLVCRQCAHLMWAVCSIDRAATMLPSRLRQLMAGPYGAIVAHVQKEIRLGRPEPLAVRIAAPTNKQAITDLLRENENG